ncbi:acylphosphatase [Oceanibacterium hippocampi]|uniref:acylphosphatase n=1 Tax=Oceanibacterium hippocampi TaxID=745714 RepID=UPI001FE722A4|nr:acylphosphatase [Oceanibacterium hippocampi]
MRGRVQGVWFRAWTRERAQALRLAGWVRNRRDGAVEALFAGPEPAVDEMLEACWEGPEAAVVKAVEPLDADVDDEGLPDGGFEIRPSD